MLPERRSLVSRLKRRLFGQDAPLAETMLCCQSIAWGALILATPQMTRTSPIIASIDRVFPEDVWGALLVVGGSIGLCAWWMCANRARAVMALAGTFMWAFATACLWRVGIPVITTTVLPIFAVTSGLIYVRLAGLVRGDS